MKYDISLDWELAIQWWGIYSRHEFSELPTEEQARLIAVYRTVKLMESVLAKAQADDIRRSG